MGTMIGIDLGTTNSCVAIMEVPLGQIVSEAVITVPAYFNDAQR